MSKADDPNSTPFDKSATGAESLSKSAFPPNLEDALTALQVDTLDLRSTIKALQAVADDHHHAAFQHLAYALTAHLSSLMGTVREFEGLVLNEDDPGRIDTMAARYT